MGENKGDSKTDNDKDLVWEEISSEHIVQDEWIDFRKSSFRFPDGTEFGPYYNYSRRNYVVVVATDEEGNYICVRQYRYGIRQVTTEFPAGGIEVDDVGGALEAAVRELKEETGYMSDEWRHLITVPSNPTLADNYAYVFEAKNCRKISGQELDDTEFLNVRKYTPGEIDKMVKEEKFQQPIHIMSWLMSKNK